MKEARSEPLLDDFFLGFYLELIEVIYGGNASGDIRSKSAVLFFAEPVFMGVNCFLTFD